MQQNTQEEKNDERHALQSSTQTSLGIMGACDPNQKKQERNVNPDDRTFD
jgi:hypothetical protein